MIMKKLFTLLLVVLFIGGVYAQNTTKDYNAKKDVNKASLTYKAFPEKGLKAFIGESFEAWPPAGWTLASPDGGTGWAQITAGTSPLPGWTGGTASVPSGGGNAHAYCTWTTGGASANDQWIISPQFSVTAGDSLTFWLYWFGSYEDSVFVKLSTTTTDVASFTTTLLALDTVDLQPTDTWIRFALDMTPYAGQNVYIGWQETVADNYNDGAFIGLDLVQMGVATAPELAIAGATTAEYPIVPVSQLSLNTYNFNAAVFNNGSDLSTATNVNINIAAASFTESQPLTIPMAGGTSQNITFSNTFNPPASAADYEAIFDVQAAGDPVPDNNLDTLMLYVSDSILARDHNDLPTGSIGIGAGSDGAFGQTFSVAAADDVTSVSFMLVGPTIGDITSVDIYDFTTEPNAVIASTVQFTIPSDQPAWYTLPLTATLSPGNYFVAINESATYNITMATSSNYYVLNSMWYKIGAAGTWTDATGSFNITLFMRVNFGLPTDVTEGFDSEISVFPNPTDGQLYITNAKDAMVVVYNMIGEVVVTENNFNKSIDLSGLSNGSYIVKIQTNNDVVTEKINIVK